MTIFALVLNLAIAPSAFASGNPEKEAKFAEKVKTNIAKLGTGPEAKVEIKLKDGTKIKGYVTEASVDKFVVKFIEKLRANIKTQGVGVNSKIKVKLKDGTKLKGYVSEVGNEQFTLIDAKTGQATQVQYSQVKQARGNNWSQKTWIGIAAAAVFLTIVLIAVSRL